MRHPRYLLIAIICFLLSLWALSGIASAQTSAPKWATALAVAGPLADGLSTHYAIGQPGTREGNPFFSRMFGSDVTRNEILGFKVGQAVLTGLAVHHVGKVDRKGAIGLAIATAGINFTVSALNYKNAQYAKRINERGRR